MGNVAAAVATTAMFLASAGPGERTPLLKLIDDAERARRDTERIQQASDEIVNAWNRWYDEARASVLQFTNQN
jgi:hypothetical protein